MDLEPDETLVWTGRPDGVRRVVRRSLPKALAGLGLVAAAAAWVGFLLWNAAQRPMFAGRGGRPGSEDLLAASIGLPMFLTGVYLITLPARLAWRLGRTRYLLTDHRAILVEPGWLGREVVWSYPPDALALMWCEEQADGWGDLVFEDRATWGNFREPAGFLGLANIRKAEALVRTTLAPGRREPAAVEIMDGLDDAGPARLQTDLAPIRTYPLGAFNRYMIYVIGLGLPIGGFVLLAGGLAILLVEAIGQLPFRADAERVVPWMVALVVLSIPLYLLGRAVSRTPLEIVLDEGQRTVKFRGLWRSRLVPISDIRSVTTGGWRDPQCSLVEVMFKDGKLRIYNDFGDFREFLFHLKALNPSVEIRGF